MNPFLKKRKKTIILSPHLLKGRGFWTSYYSKTNKQMTDFFKVSHLLALCLEIKGTNPDMEYSKFHEYMVEDILPKVISDISKGNRKSSDFDTLVTKQQNTINELQRQYKKHPAYGSILMCDKIKLPSKNYPSLDFESIMNMVWNNSEIRPQTIEHDSKRKKYFLKIIEMTAVGNEYRVDLESRTGELYMFYARKSSISNLSYGDCIKIEGVPVLGTNLDHIPLNSVITLRNIEGVPVLGTNLDYIPLNSVIILRNYGKKSSGKTINDIKVITNIGKNLTCKWKVDYSDLYMDQPWN